MNPYMTIIFDEITTTRKIVRRAGEQAAGAFLGAAPGENGFVVRTLDDLFL